MKPSISIVTVVFNDVQEIVETLDSVLAQSYENFQYIVIDGDSSDGTQGVLKSYSDRIDIYVSEPDEGVYDAMNKAVLLATGEYLLFMNCGDHFFNETALENAVSEMTSSSLPQVFFGQWIRRENSGVEQLCKPDLQHGIFNHQAVLYSRSIHSWHGLYLSVNKFTTADYLFFASLFTSKKVECKVICSVVAAIDVNGISSGAQTLSQKNTIDYLFGSIGKPYLVVVLLLHPMYRLIRKLMFWRK